MIVIVRYSNIKYRKVYVTFPYYDHSYELLKHSKDIVVDSNSSHELWYDE